MRFPHVTGSVSPSGATVCEFCLLTFNEDLHNECSVRLRAEVNRLQGETVNLLRRLRRNMDGLGVDDTDACISMLDDEIAELSR